MEKGYYAPNIEEFHIGFEFEIFNNDTDKYDKHTYIEDDDVFGLEDCRDYYEDLRVKYLDEEDILSFPHMTKLEPMENPYADNYLGVEMDPFQRYLLDINALHRYEILMLHDRARSIINISDMSGNHEFRGECLNKSELKRLLFKIGAFK